MTSRLFFDRRPIPWVIAAQGRPCYDSPARLKGARWAGMGPPSTVLRGELPELQYWVRQSGADTAAIDHASGMRSRHAQSRQASFAGAGGGTRGIQDTRQVDYQTPATAHYIYV